MDEHAVNTLEGPVPMSYEECNRKLVQHFFNEEHAGDEVRLYLQDSELAGVIPGGIDTLIQAVKKECAAINKHKITSLASHYARKWRNKYYVATDQETSAQIDFSAPCPEILPVLVLLIHAVYCGEDTCGDEYDANAYYGRINEQFLSVYGMPELGSDDLARLAPTTTNSDDGAWKCLEHWSKVHKRAELGCFEAVPIREYARNRNYVGYVQRQALLGSPRDRDALYRQFQASHLRHDSKLSNYQLEVLARRSNISTRMKNLLENPSSYESKEVINEIRILFNNWDCSFKNVDTNESLQLSIRLRISLDFDAWTFRDASYQVSFPQDTENDEEVHLDPIFEVGFPPSLSLKAEYGSKYANLVNILEKSDWASETDWFSEISINGQIESKDITLTRESTTFIIFEKDYYSGDYIEIYKNELVPNESYLLVCPTSKKEKPGCVLEFTMDWRDDLFPEGFSYRPFKPNLGSEDPSYDLDPVIEFQGGLKRGGCYSIHGLPELVINAPESDMGSIHVSAEYFNSNNRKIYTEDVTIEPVVDASFEREFNEIFGVSFAFRPEYRARLSVKEGVQDVVRIILYVEPHNETKTVFIRPQPVDADDWKEFPERNAYGLLLGEREEAMFCGLAVICEQSPQATFSFSASNRPSLPESDDLYLNHPGFKLMEHLRSETNRTISWSAAKRDIPKITPSINYDKRSGGVSLIDQLLVLHSLGIVEVVEKEGGGIDSITAIKPKIILLPELRNCGLDAKRGVLQRKYEALLVGCWTRSEIKQLGKYAKDEMMSLDSIIRSGNDLAPPRQTLSAYSEWDVLTLRKRLIQIAMRARVESELDVPLSQQIISVLPNIDLLLSSVNWDAKTPIPDAWKIRYFNPTNFSLLTDRIKTSERYELWECQYLNRRVFRYFIIDNLANKHCEIQDRQLARWLMRMQSDPLKSVPISPTDDLVLPEALRLPRVLERSISLFNGFPPMHSKNEIIYRGFARSLLWRSNQPMPMMGCKYHR